MNKDQILKWFRNHYEFTVVPIYNGDAYEIRLCEYKFTVILANLYFYNLRLTKNAQIEVGDSGGYYFKEVTEKMLNDRLAKFKKRKQDLDKLSKQETVEIKLKALRKEFEDD